MLEKNELELINDMVLEIIGWYRYTANEDDVIYNIQEDGEDYIIFKNDATGDEFKITVDKI